MKFKTSEFVEKCYNDFTASLNKEKIAQGNIGVIDISIYEKFYKLQSLERQQVNKGMGDDFIQSQVFVPAGRSFFTSLGKAVAAFEQSGHLDPVTVAFGRLFTALRDRGSLLHWRRPDVDKQHTGFRKELGQELFGGELRNEKDKEFVETLDGRTIPFALLSSGQQELLPLWIVLEYVMEMGTITSLLYIEEPEAHLFPSAQSDIIEYMISMLSNTRRLFITTHSPYVLTKINTLIKAGILASRLGKSAEGRIASVVNRRAWLRSNQVKAYAFIDHQLKSIMDDDGLINAEYLDTVSDSLSHQFSSLLEIEFSR